MATSPCSSTSTTSLTTTQAWTFKTPTSYTENPSWCSCCWESYCWNRDERESRWSLGIDIFCPVSTGLGLDIHWFSQSRWVSVSTSKKFLSLDESRSRHPRNLSVSMSLGLDIHKISKSCWVIKQRKAKQKESNQTRYNQSKSIHLLDWVCFLQHQILTFDGWVSPVREKKSRPTNQKTRIISEISMSLDGVSVSGMVRCRSQIFENRVGGNTRWCLVIRNFSGRIRNSNNDHIFTRH